MSTMTLSLPTPVRAPSNPPARPAEASSSQALQDDEPKPSGFGRTLEQAQEEQAPAADQAGVVYPAVTGDSAPTDTTPATEAPLQPWLSAVLSAPAATIQPFQAQAAGLSGSNQQATPLPEQATSATSGATGNRPVETASLLQQAPSATMQVRAAQQVAPQTASPDDLSGDVDALASALSSSTQGASSAATTSARQQAPALAQAITSNTSNLSNTEQRPSVAPATPQVSPTWSSTLADTSFATQSPSGPVPLPTTPNQWREPLLNALGERVQWQLQRGQEQAVIRLEPANLGRVEIHIRQDAGGLQVHLSATHREVAQQLQGLSDQLRTELSLRHAGDVAVGVSDQGREADGRQRSRGQPPDQDQTPGRALGDAGLSTQKRTAFALSGSSAEGS